MKSFKDTQNQTTILKKLILIEIANDQAVHASITFSTLLLERRGF